MVVLGTAESARLFRLCFAIHVAVGDYMCCASFLRQEAVSDLGAGEYIQTGVLEI